MALVRISNELRSSIISKLNEVYRNKIYAATESYNKNWGTIVYSKLMEPYASRVQLAPAEFLNTTDVMSLVGIAGYLFPTPLRFQLGAASWPNSIAATSRVWPQVHSHDYRGIILKDDRGWLGELRQEMVDYVTRCRVVGEQQVQSQDAISTLLENHNTLASALEAWPALMELVPEEAKARHAAPNAKAKKMFAVAPDMDKLNALTLDFAKNRLTDKK